MAGYQRQSAASIQPNQPVTASIFNAEFNALVTAMASSGGHSHDGSVGEGARISYEDILDKPTIITVGSTTPAALGTAAPGVSTQAARADHVHAKPTAADIGAATSAHTHSNVTSSVAGFMSAADKNKLDTVEAGSRPGTVTSVAAGTGMSFVTILNSGTVAIDTNIVATKNATNNFNNNIIQNPILMAEAYPVIAKGTVSGSVTCDLSTGSFFTMTVGASSTQVTFTNAKSGRAHMVFLAVTFTSSPTFSITGDLTKGTPAPFVWSSASANSQSWSTSGTDYLMCITFNGGSTWLVVRLAASPT